MIDLKVLRSDPEAIRDSLRKRGSPFDLDALVQMEARHRELLAAVEALRARQNEVSRRVRSATGDDRTAAIEEAKVVAEQVREAERTLQEVRAELDARLASVPNLLHPDVPEGIDDSANVVVRQVGEPRTTNFDALDHLAIGENLGIIDVERAAKVSGTRFGILRGAGALLELALVRFALDRLGADGFTPVVPPVLVRREAMFGTGFFPSEESQAYAIEQDELWLTGTSEVPLAAMHAGEVLGAAELPLRYAGFSTCFRREAGTYGRDTRGIIRVHQFDKVEMFVYCTPDTSDQGHLALLAREEATFRDLEIPYRVVEVCAGELGAPYSRKFDVEAWLPGAQRWLEVTSCSNALDYQARRLNIRFRADSGGVFVHTLNGTAVAVGRAIVALLENHQQADGSVRVPQALQPYTGFELIKA